MNQRINKLFNDSQLIIQSIIQRNAQESMYQLSRIKSLFHGSINRDSYSILSIKQEKLS